MDSDIINIVFVRYNFMQGYSWNLEGCFILKLDPHWLISDEDIDK